jgi:VWFA-related protein
MRPATGIGILALFVVLCVAAAQEPTFRSESNVVLVPALVKNAKGDAVYGLQAKDFVIEDDGVEQPVRLDEEAEAEPASIVLAVQTGRRAKREFQRMRGLRAMLAPVLDQPGAQIALLEFDSKLELTQDFTSNGNAIDQALGELQEGDNGAAILDAVAYSVKLLGRLPKGRQRVILLISENRDHGSHFASIDQVVTAVGESNTVIYALTFSPSLSQVLDTERGSNRDEAYWGAPPDLLAPLIMARHAMEKNAARAVASMTGGEYESFASQKGFDRLMNRFTNHLHSRYLLSFEPRNPHPGLHQIRVRMKDADDASVLSRSSYWAAGASPSPE